MAELKFPHIPLTAFLVWLRVCSFALVMHGVRLFNNL
nr:MAG TPA: hypothetical protein [Caudoviricetes sp.]